MLNLQSYPLWRWLMPAERRTLFDLMPPPLRWIVNAVPIIVALILLALAAGLWADAQDPRGTIAWLMSQGVNPFAISAVTLVCALILVILHRRLRFYTVCGAVTYGILTLPYPLYCICAGYYVLIVSPVGSRTAVVAFATGYIFGLLLIVKAGLIALWANSVEARQP